MGKPKVPITGRSSAKKKSDKHTATTKYGREKGKSNHSMNPNRPKESVKGVGNPRTAGTIKRLQMYRCTKVCLIFFRLLRTVSCLYRHQNYSDFQLFNLVKKILTMLKLMAIDLK